MNNRFQCTENTYHLRLTAKQNGSRNVMMQPVGLTVLFYNANDREICLLHSFRKIRFGEHVERHNLITFL